VAASAGRRRADRVRTDDPGGQEVESLIAALLEIDPQFLDRWVAYCRARASFDAETVMDLRD
jgi:hypothetical protein